MPICGGWCASSAWSREALSRGSPTTACNSASPRARRRWRRYWSGVIIGPDFVWRGDRWVTDRTKSKDPAFKKATTDADVDRLIRNTYKVLLTRGMVGTIVYSTDPESQERLRELVDARRSAVRI